MMELLVSMAITSILMITLLSLVGQSTDSYTRTQKAVNSLSQARAFMQFFEKEISTNLPDTHLLYEKTENSSQESPVNSDKLLFIRTLSTDEETDTDPGDIGTTHYYVAITADRGSAVSPKLYRQILGSEKTQELIEAGDGIAFPAQNPSGATDPDEPLVYNVIDFTAQPKYRDSTGALLEWDDTLDEAPVVIDLTIRFVDDSTGERFKTKAKWDALAQDATDTDSANYSLIQTFSRTIAIGE